MQDPLTYRYPRTMQEAFGPYTDNTLYPLQEETKMDYQDKAILVACAIAFIMWAVVTVMEGKV